MKKIVAICATSLIAATLSLSALAADGENFWMKNNRVSIGVGVFFVEESTEVRLSSDTVGLGTKFSFQDDLGFDDDEEVARIAGHYRFKPRHRLSFSYFDISRDATATVVRDIKYEDVVFPAGVTVDSKLGFTVLNILYTYSFFQNEKFDLGFTSGVNIYEFDSSLTAPATGVEQDSDGTAPFPVLGIRTIYAFNPKWLFGASLDYFEIDEGDVEGEVVDILIAVEHQTWKNVGLGLGYNDVSIEAEQKEDRDELDWEYDGFFGYARFSF